MVHLFGGVFLYLLVGGISSWGLSIPLELLQAQASRRSEFLYAGQIGFQKQVSYVNPAGGAWAWGLGCVTTVGFCWLQGRL